MARKTNRPPRPDHDPASSAAQHNEIRIKEDSAKEDYFKRQDDPYVLPPELNMTIKDGFRFGIGFALAMLVLYIIVIIGLIIFVKFGKIINLG